MPDLTDPTCSWVEHEVVASSDTCRRLTPTPGYSVRFRGDGDESCRGAPCVELDPGEGAVVLGSAADLNVRYTEVLGDCGDPPRCP